MQVGFRLVEAAQRYFRRRSRLVQTRIVRIDGEAGVSCADRFVKTVRIAQVKALKHGRLVAIRSEADRAIRLTEHFCVIVGPRTSPTEQVLTEICCSNAGDGRRVVGIDRQRLFEQGPRGIDLFLTGKKSWVIYERPTAHDEIVRIRIGRAGAFRCFRLDEFVAQGVRKPRHDFVLQLEKIGDVLLEPLGLKMGTGFGVDELRVHTHAVLVALY